TVDIHHHTALEAHLGVQGRETANIAVVGGVEPCRWQQDAVRVEGHAEARSSYYVDDVDDGRVGEIDANRIRYQRIALLFVRDELEEQADVILVPLQHLFGFGSGSVGGEAHHVGFDRQIPAIIFRVVRYHHGHNTESLRGLCA